MPCTACGYESPSGKKFCGECGAQLQLKCPSCGFANASGIKFCGECGEDALIVAGAPLEVGCQEEGAPQ